MNFLAHLYLSGNEPAVLVGNFIGDFVKGRNMLQQLDPSIVRGIALHRAIDAFTDHHPVVTESKNRLRPRYRHYAGVIVDVFYDHYLARNWSQYHTMSLARFAADAYDVLQRYRSTLPPRASDMLPYMIRGNWLVHYAETEGIHAALSGMARRTPYQSHMDEAVNDLRRHDSAFKAEFEKFFPDVQSHAASFLRNTPSAR